MPTKRVTAGTKYLAGWRDIEGSERRALDSLGDDYNCHNALIALTQDGYVVSIHGSVGHYCVTCLPVRNTPYRVDQGVALSYCGSELEYILSCASYEADLVLVSPHDAILDDKEQCRWATR